MSVAGRKMWDIGDLTGRRDSIALDLAEISRDSINRALRVVIASETAAQIRLDNPPQVMTVDNASGKPLEQAERKVVVLFGTVLARAAMATLESTLRASILASTTARTGRLSDVSASWEWRLIRGGKNGSSRVISSPEEIKGFGFNDRLVLTPRAPLNYAWIVNSLVARSGRLAVKTRGKRGKKGTAEFQSKRLSNLGFIAATAVAIRKHPAFRDFSVHAAFTRRYGVSDEIGPHGTPYFTIRPKRRGRLPH